MKLNEGIEENGQSSSDGMNRYEMTRATVIGSMKNSRSGPLEQRPHHLWSQGEEEFRWF